jgi:hypothetical protein
MEHTLGKRLGALELGWRNPGHCPAGNVADGAEPLHGRCDNGLVDDGRFNEILARIDRNSEDTRLYIRESGIRFERAMQAMERRMQRLEEETRENGAQTRAHTQAIWALLDRWGYGPPPPEPA